MTLGKIAANLIINDLLGLLKKNKLTIEQSPIKPETIRMFAELQHKGLLTNKSVRKLLTKFFYENLENEQEKNSNDEESGESKSQES